MKSHLTGLALVALLVVGPTLPGHAEETTTPASPAATPTEAPPLSVPRPSLVPKAAEPSPSAPSAATDPAQPTMPRAAHRHYRRWGIYRTAYWEPFPIYWPHFYHHRIHWNRIRWAFRF